MPSRSDGFDRLHRGGGSWLHSGSRLGGHRSPTIHYRREHHDRTTHYRRLHVDHYPLKRHHNTIVGFGYYDRSYYPHRWYYGSAYDYYPYYPGGYYPSTVVVTDPSPDVVVEPVPVPVYEAPETLEETLDGSQVIYPSAPGADVPDLENLPPDEAPTFLEEGESAFAEGKYDEARSLFRRALMTLSDDAYAQLDYGLVHFAMGDYAVSAEAFRRALVADPDLLDRIPDVSTAYGVEGDFEKHLDALQSHLDDNPTDTNSRFLLGLVLFSVGDPEAAVSELSRVVHRNPQDTVSYLLRDAALRALETPPPDEPSQDAEE